MLPSLLAHEIKNSLKHFFAHRLQAFLPLVRGRHAALNPRRTLNFLTLTDQSKRESLEQNALIQ
ncbi:MAG: hypothetical protein IPJ48_03990 [Propionivibrio sp.]|uniref:Uncharacterized protein n=1 Tax=Candidatus Propionivibrio dominans TaxID=2954373 RepID=A0A9D7FC71_9RHOO|nr:hypothetical protein [Candidatus Propionivibrio dominans]MBL0168497.1 hypothetical protein [Propionivibrio sp.]